MGRRIEGLINGLLLKGPVRGELPKDGTLDNFINNGDAYSNSLSVGEMISVTGMYLGISGILFSVSYLIN